LPTGDALRGFPGCAQTLAGQRSIALPDDSLKMVYAQFRGVLLRPRSRLDEAGAIHPRLPSSLVDSGAARRSPEWEVLPQEAGPGEVILSKRHELGLLSNFAPTPFTFRGRRYASLEGFWQMMLYPESEE
jgi:hypothetical protein